MHGLPRLGAPSLPACQHRPDRSRQLVGYRGDSHFVRPALQQSYQPWPGQAILGSDHNGSRAVHEQRSQVSVATLADSQLPYPPAGPGLARDQSDPRRKLPSVLERSRRSHAGDYRSRGEKTNSGDLGDSLAGRYVPHLLRQPSLDEADVGLQLQHSPELLVKAFHEHRWQPRFCVAHGVGQGLEQCRMTLRQHDAKLVEQPPEFVGLHDAGLHELRAHPVQRQHDLLGLGLDRNEAHAWLLAGCPDRLSVRSVGFVALHERTHLARRDESYLVAQFHQGSAPVVRTAARFHDDQRSRAVGKPLEHLGALQLQVLNAAGIHLDSVQLKHLLGNVDGNDGMFHDGFHFDVDDGIVNLALTGPQCK